MMRASKMSYRPIPDIAVGNLVMGNFAGKQKFVAIKTNYNGNEGFVFFESKDGKKIVKFEDIDHANLLDLGSEWEVLVDRPQDGLDGRGRLNSRQVDFGLLVTENSQYLNVFFRHDYGQYVVHYMRLSRERGTWDNEMGAHVKLMLFVDFKFVVPGDQKAGLGPTIIDPWNL